MPELPELEGARAALTEVLVGRVVAGVQLLDFSALKTFQPGLDALVGLEIDGVHRYGKHLDVEAHGIHLVIHLSRAGWFAWRAEAPTGLGRPGKGPLTLRMLLDDGSAFDVTEAGTQRRVSLHVVTDLATIPAIATLGVEPLSPELTDDVLARLLADAGRAQLKGVLRDQHVLAGIGNAWSDEILHTAKLGPFTPASSLTAEEQARLGAAIRDVLGAAVDAAVGQPLSALKDTKRAGLQVHGRTGLPCPVCGDTVAEVSFADSSLQYCPTCQTGGRLLADRRRSKLLR